MNQRLFVIASIMTQLGSALSNMGLAYRFLLETESGFEYGILIYTAFLSSLVLSPPLAKWIDAQENPWAYLLPVNLLLAILHLILAFATSLPSAAVLVLLTSTLSNLENAILFKTLPNMLPKRTFLRLNITLQEIASFGFIFGPLFAPFLKCIFETDSALFLIDSLTFLIAGFLFHKIFEHTVIKKQLCDLKKTNLFSSYAQLLSSKSAFLFFASFLSYMLAFSSMAYTLALVSKSASGGDEWLYGLPIVSMFLGRMLGLFYLKRTNKLPLKKIYQSALCAAAIFILPLSFVLNIYLLSFLEFFLGISIGALRFSESAYFQTEFPSLHLGKLSALRTLGSHLTKLLGIPIVLLLINHEQGQWSTPFLALCYFTAFLLSTRAFVRIEGSYKKP